MSPGQKHSRPTGRVGEVLFSKWAEFQHLRKVALKRKEAEDFHDLRVASRRMRAILDLFIPFIHGRVVKRLNREIKGITRELGRLRNIDEALLYFGQDEALFPVLQPKLANMRKDELKSVVKVLKQMPIHDMEQMLGLAVADLSKNEQQASPDLNLPAYLSQTAINRFQAVYDLILPATEPEDAETRHLLRIAIKKWRYLLETMGQISGNDYHEAIDLLKEYQTVLGSLNDMREFKALCDKHKLRLSHDVLAEISAMLAKDTDRYLEGFLDLANSHRPQYVLHT